MHTRKRFPALLTALALLLALAGTALAAPPEPDAAPAAYTVPEDMEGKLVILHTNDVHGGIDGYAAIAALKAQFAEAGASVLLLDAGDFSQGATTVSVSQGASAVELMNLAGYDAAAPGNHEFDYGYENLKTLVEAAQFPVLSANIFYNGENAFPSRTVFELDGLKVGVFGLDTPETATKAHPGKIKGITLTGGQAMYELAQAQVDALSEAGCDYIICLGHLGIDDESAAGGNRSIDLLGTVTGIDVFIDGHSHSTLEDISEATGGACKVGDTYLTSTGTKLANIGIVTLDGEEVSLQCVPTGTCAGSTPEVAQRVEAIKAEIEAEYGAAFAASTVDLNGERDPGNRTEETNLGDLIADAMLWCALRDGDLEVDRDHVVALTNGGGIRASIPVGDISKNDVNTVLPFGNTVAIIYVTGEQLLEVLEASTYSTPTAVGGFPQISGLTFTLDTGKAFDQGELYPKTTYYAPASINRVTVNAVNGQPFSLTDTYAVVSNDFLASGGDTYYAFSVANVMDTGTPLDEALVQYITDVLDGTVGEQYAAPAGRIVITAPAAQQPPVEEVPAQQPPVEEVPVEQPPVEETPAPQDALAYTVAYGDTMGNIALNYYGSYARHLALYAANAGAFARTNGRLEPGMTLTLPAVLDGAARIPAPVPTQGERLYTVQSGDTLASIAAAQCGSAALYKDIFARNSDRLKDVNTLYTGQIIVLPAAPAQTQVENTPAPDEGNAAGETPYVVRAGDSLSAIALRHYGDAAKWSVIYERNRDAIRDPNAIYTGQTIILPAQ